MTHTSRLAMSDDTVNLEFYAFRYPLFHLDMLVLAAVAACFCLLAIWAGLSARHWFWRAAAIVLSILALLPIQAHQPALMLIIALPAISLTVARMNRRGVGPDSVQTSDALRLRFGLKDLLLAVLLTAALSYGATVLIERRADLDWKRAVTGAAALCLFAVMCYWVVFARRRRLLILGALFVVILLNAAGETWAGFGWGGELIEVQSAQDIMFDMTDMLSGQNFRIEEFSCLALAGAEFCLLLGGLLILAFRRLAGRTNRARRLVLGTRGLIGFCIAIGAAVLYWQMLQDSALGRHASDEPNAYPRLVELARQVEAWNRSAVPPDDFVASNDAQQRGKAQELEALYREGIRLTAEPGHVPVDVVREYFRGSSFDDLVAFRDLATAWRAEGESLAVKEKHDEAADYHLASISMANGVCRGGVVLHELVGNACEGIGVAGLAPIRAKLSPRRARHLLAQLSRIDASREPIAAIDARDQASVRESAAWRSRFAQAVAAWLNVRLGVGEELLTSGRHRREAEIRLLMADLAVRLYQREHERLPQTLSDLVPSYLPSVPIDPYSGQPLIYRPEDGSFLLYSVGQDGSDDGGCIRPDGESFLAPGYDIRLAPVEE
jgi:hypothetical protein